MTGTFRVFVFVVIALTAGLEPAPFSNRLITSLLFMLCNFAQQWFPVNGQTTRRPITLR
jgi:hypothetical protein